MLDGTKKCGAISYTFPYKKQRTHSRTIIGVMVFNLSEEEPSWNICLPSLLHCHSFACNFTPFKGVSDILLLGTKCGPYFDPCADH